MSGAVAAARGRPPVKIESVPFLNRLARWASERADQIAVVCGTEHLSWSELHAEALRHSVEEAERPGPRVLREPNSVGFVVRWAAGVAGDRECAVLDPEWPQELAEEVLGRLRDRATASGIRHGQEAVGLRDGEPTSSFLVGLTSGTTSLPKAFSHTPDLGMIR